MVIGQDEGGGSGAEAGSAAPSPSLSMSGTRPSERACDRGVCRTCEAARPPSSTAHRWRSLTRSQRSKSRARAGRRISAGPEQGDHLVVLGVRDVPEPALAVGPAGELDGCLAAIDATWQPCSAWESPLRRTCPRKFWSARFMAASTAFVVMGRALSSPVEES
jgi:ribosomal protein L40E